MCELIIDAELQAMLDAGSMKARDSLSNPYSLTDDELRVRLSIAIGQHHAQCDFAARVSQPPASADLNSPSGFSGVGGNLLEMMA